MAKYRKSLLELLTEMESVSSKIVNTLYTIEDLEREGYTKNKEEIDRLNEEVGRLRDRDQYIQGKLKEIDSSLKYRIHRLFA